MTAPAVITGVGLVTALGSSPEQTWEALLAGGAITDHARIPGFAAGNRAAQLALTAARQAIAQAGWTAPILAAADTGLFLGTSKGPIENWLSSGPGPDGLGQIAASLAAELHMGCGPRLTLSAACASGLHALIRAAMSLDAREAQRALVVAVEAAVHPLFLASFQRLGVLAPQGHGCRPFDQNRRGFFMSEAAAAVCLESAEQATVSPLARLDRFAMGGDATHLTATDPEAQTLRRLLQQVIDGRGVDFVHAHGTGTLLNDPAELSAIESAVATTGDCPLVYSHKAALGHSQGAAGLVSVVLNCLCHRDAVVPPNVNTTQPLPTRAVRISHQAQRASIRRSVAIASGFGGPVAVIGLVSA